MTTTPDRVLDDLDRLAFRLQRVIRAQYPALAASGFTLADLEERLLPARDSRRELAGAGAAAWERAMLRLLSGERGYLVADPDIREAARRALAHAAPSMGLVRAWATAPLHMGSGAQLSDSDTAHGAPVGHDPAAPAAASGCRYCSGRLPTERAVTFCPHCGHDLTKRQCPACCAELEVGWRFCVTCGRGAVLADQMRAAALDLGAPTG